MTHNYFTLKEASIFLGIPPQVIKACLRAPVRPNGKFKLNTIQNGSTPMFLEQDLIDFSKDLYLPWVNDKEKDKRPHLPTSIEDAIYFEAAEVCGSCEDDWDLEVAHILEWSKCNHHHPANLILLCGKCHKLHDREKAISIETLKVLKARLVNRWTASLKKINTVKVHMTHEALKAAIHELLSRNNFLFRSMGPRSERTGDDAGVTIWDEIKTTEIIPNNRSVMTLIQLNEHLIAKDTTFASLAKKFIDHAVSFEKFVQAPNEEHANHLFPTDFADFVKKTEAL